MASVSGLLSPASPDADIPVDPGPAAHTRQCAHCGATLTPKRYATAWRIFYAPAVCDCPAAAAERAEAEAAKDREAREHELMQLLYASGLMAGHFEKFTFQRWDVTRSGGAAKAPAESVKQYLADVEPTGKNWLWLSGRYGLGKTHLAVATVRKLAIDRLWQPHVVVWPELCQQTQESWSSDDGESEGSLWARTRRAGVLLIDDLDKTSTGEWAMGKLFGLVNYRSERQLPTIITANRGVSELQTIWGGSNKPHVADTGMAILSRIVGQLWGVVGFQGEDQRVGE